MPLAKLVSTCIGIKPLLAEQLQAFKQQIDWAKALKLPIVIHCRDAFDEVYEVFAAGTG